MSRPDRPGDRPGDHADDPVTPDPLAGFFAAERDRVRPLPADEVRWQRIAREHRSRGGSWRRYAAAAAAVVVLGSGVGLATTLRGDAPAPAAQPTVTRTVYVEATPSPSSRAVTPAPTAPTPLTSAPTGGTAPTTAVPADFTVLSLTTLGSGRLFALGSSTCDGQPCALVVTSADGGSTWSVRGRVPGVTAAPRLAASTSSPTGVRVGSGSGVTDVRFASDTVGWVFGQTVLRTTDGGRTWAPYAYGSSGPVLALETDGTDVALASATACGAATCTGEVSVSRAGVGAPSAARVGAPLALGQAFLGLDLAWRQRSVVLSVRAGSQDPPPALVAGASVTTLPAPGCPSGTAAVTAPADGSALLLFCGATTVGGQLGPVLTGDGSAWTQAAASGPAAATLGARDLVSAAAVDGQHLVLAAGGAGGTGALAVSADAGRTWRVPSSPSAPGTGFAWVGSPGGRTVYALPAVPDGSFWRSDDAGQTWRQVRVG